MTYRLAVLSIRLKKVVGRLCLPPGLVLSSEDGMDGANILKWMWCSLLNGEDGD
jgi:hypothetical protein